jgi:glycosyltransferase involved in cell wall biosynthesis
MPQFFKTGGNLGRNDMSDRDVTSGNAVLKQSSPFYKTQTDGTFKRRPKLLFLAYYFPPANAVSCVRTWNIAKYLTRLGWDITVVTLDPFLWRHTDNPGETEINIKQEGFRRILTGHRWRWLSPDNLKCHNRHLGWFIAGACRKIARYSHIERECGWIKTAEQACRVLKSDDVDIILATAPPFGALDLARRLSLRLGRPYVLDYRDPWMGNPAVSFSRSRTILKERGLLSGCAAVTIVSPGWSANVDRRYGFGSKTHVITNGYDPEELAQVQPYKFGHFAIVYTGSFCPPKRVISPVMAALKSLKHYVKGNGKEWFFHYYGPHENHVREEAMRFGVMERVILHGTVSRTEALSAVRGAGIATVIVSVNEQATLAERGWVPAKLFEAIGLGTPILIVTPPGSDIETIADATGSAGIFTGSNINGIAFFLASAIRGQIPQPRNTATSAWTTLITNLDNVLRRAISKKRELPGDAEVCVSDHDDQRPFLRSDIS